MDPAPGHPRPRAPDLTGEERNALWDHATRAAADATAQIRTLARTDPAAAADAAWATSDTLHVAAAMLGSRILRQAADAYDRAACAPYGRIPPPTPAGNQLRQAARLLSAFAYLTGDRPLTPIVLITRLAALAEAVAGCANPSSTPPRPPPPSPPPNASTPPPGRPRLCSHARPRAPAPPPSSPGCPSPSQHGPPRSRATARSRAHYAARSEEVSGGPAARNDAENRHARHNRKWRAQDIGAPGRGLNVGSGS